VSKIWKNRKVAVEICGREYLRKKNPRGAVYGYCLLFLRDPAAGEFVDNAALSNMQRSRFIYDVIKFIRAEDSTAFTVPLDRVPYDKGGN
jgi:hypothetical protein